MIIVLYVFKGSLIELFSSYVCMHVCTYLDAKVMKCLCLHVHEHVHVYVHVHTGQGNERRVHARRCIFTYMCAHAR
jgi:hypothetical protein